MRARASSKIMVNIDERRALILISGLAENCINDQLARLFGIGLGCAIWCSETSFRSSSQSIGYRYVEN